MARHTKIVEIKSPDETYRDRDKVFLITEMDAFRGDSWAKRLLILLARVDVDLALVANWENLGWQGAAQLGLQAVSSLDWRDAEPLLAELMSCVQIIPDPRSSMLPRQIGLGGAEDISEIPTITYLQTEVFNLHANFSKTVADWISKLIPKAAAGGTQNISTSQPRSARSSRRAKQA